MHFNIAYESGSLVLTLINPNISVETMRYIQEGMKYVEVRRLEVVMIECVNFDDELLGELAKAMPETLEELRLDFTSCESLRG